MIKKRTRLGLVLVACTVISFIVAAAAFLGLNRAAEALIDDVVFTREKILENEKEYFAEFLAYMNSGGHSLSERASVQKWVSTKKNLMLAIYDARSSYFTSGGDGVLYSTVSDALTLYDLLQNEYADYWYSCPVMTSGDIMRSRVVKVMYFPMYRVRDYALYGNAAASFLIFAGVMLACINRKTAYIARLSRELQVMQGGDLSVPMTIRGKDELTTLAENIEQMRVSFIERLRHEENMIKNSSELLTAMSHDLRTPLTALIGYLDIIDLGKCATQEQIQRYVHSSKLKAYQIKEMTDKLFEYFLVYSASEDTMDMELADAASAFSQLWGDSALILETEGFAIDAPEPEGTCQVYINAPFMRRVFDNIVSNVRKYADSASPVKVYMGARDGAYEVCVQNAVADNAPRAESSGIGLASCQKIIERHMGAFETQLHDGVFTSRFTIPEAETHSNGTD